MAMVRLTWVWSNWIVARIGLCRTLLQSRSVGTVVVLVAMRVSSEKRARDEPVFGGPGGSRAPSGADLAGRGQVGTRRIAAVEVVDRPVVGIAIEGRVRLL